MGISALVILYVARRGDVRVLVVLYAVNVFLTFSLSQLGMVLHWWQVRREEPRWGRRSPERARPFFTSSSSSPC